MSTFTEAQWQAHKRALAARHHETFGVQPGQFATVRDESDEAIRARNAACTPIRAWVPEGDQAL